MALLKSCKLNHPYDQIYLYEQEKSMCVCDHYNELISDLLLPGAVRWCFQEAVAMKMCQFHPNRTPRQIRGINLIIVGIWLGGAWTNAWTNATH